MSLECILLLHLCLYLRTLVLSLNHLAPTQRVFWHRITNPVTFVSLPYLLVCQHQFPQPSAIPPLRFLCFLAASLLRSTGYMLNPVFSVFISFGLSAFWHSWSFFLLEIPFFFFKKTQFLGYQIDLFFPVLFGLSLRFFYWFFLNLSGPKLICLCKFRNHPKFISLT